MNKIRIVFLFSKIIRSTFAFIVALIAGCNAQVNIENSATATPIIITSTLPPAPLLSPTDNPLPPILPTVIPAEGITSTQINVRTEPSTASDVLGVIAENTKVEIIGKDPSGNWWQIIYPVGNDGKGWVAAQYVTTANQPEVPTIGGDASEQILGNNGVITQQINVRNGPGTSFDSLGILNANDMVTITGRNSDGSWFQISFTNGPDGNGWVNAAFVKTDGVNGLPIVADSGTVIGTGTPVDTPLPSTPTLVPAPMDFDSPETPVKTVILEGAGTQTVLYNGEVSSPEGDTDDWVAITLNNDVMFIGIQCFGSALIHTEIVGTAESLVCGEDIKAIPIHENTSLLVHIMAVSSSDQLQYSNYILTIKASP